MHRGADFDASRVAVEDQSPGLVFEDRNQPVIITQIFGRAVNRGGQVALQVARDLFHLLARIATDDDSRGAEDLFAQFVMAHKRARVRGEDGGTRFGLCGVGFYPRSGYLQPSEVAESLHSRFVAFQNAGVEHRSRLRAGDQPAELICELREVFVEHPDGQPRTCAELSHAERDRILQSFGDRFRAFAQSPGQNKDGVDAAHLGVNGNRIEAAGGGVKKRAPAAQRAGEADRPRKRMFDQTDADLMPRAVKQ
jgi:hypothetical protein